MCNLYWARQGQTDIEVTFTLVISFTKASIHNSVHVHFILHVTRKITPYVDNEIMPALHCIES